MLGAIGGFTGWLWMADIAMLAGILLFGAVAIVAGAYIAASRHDIDGTTEITALIVLTAGVLAGIGSVRLARPTCRPRLRPLRSRWACSAIRR
jgi:hypothetical protein